MKLTQVLITHNPFTTYCRSSTVQVHRSGYVTLFYDVGVLLQRGAKGGAHIFTGIYIPIIWDKLWVMKVEDRIIELKEAEII